MARRSPPRKVAQVTLYPWKANRSRSDAYAGSSGRTARIEAVLLHILVEHHQIVEYPHHRTLGEHRRFFEDRHASRACPGYTF